MKKIILAAVLAVFAVGVQAQDWNKGDWFSGAQLDNLGVNHTSWDGGSSTEFGLSVNAGYFLSNKFAVDATAGFLTSSTKIDGIDVKTKNTAAVFGFGVRYYPVSNLFARVGYELRAEKDWNPENYIGLEVGYDLFVSDKVFFTPAVYYKKGLENEQIADNDNFGLSIGVGVRF